MANRMVDEVAANRFILVASITAVIGGILTTAMSFLGTFRFNVFNLIDAAILFGLAFGVYRKSRTCAIILLVYHLGTRFDMYQRTGNLSAAFGLVAIGVTAIYFLAILGTFAFHAIRMEQSSTPASL